ncbi:MAG: hypothetical protein FWC89_05590 [Defluviitaleaceae bacterium]|nr:hypothetical protein [Defluviitaleaceae bacterium]
MRCIKFRIVVIIVLLIIAAVAFVWFRTPRYEEREFRGTFVRSFAKYGYLYQAEEEIGLEG